MKTTANLELDQTIGLVSKLAYLGFGLVIAGALLGFVI
jgi:hypothetical protein